MMLNLLLHSNGILVVVSDVLAHGHQLVRLAALVNNPDHLGAFID
jgi:hypothetical protein